MVVVVRLGGFQALLGRPQALPRGLDCAAYRIVQEALTSVVKRARTGRAWATVAYAPGAIQARSSMPWAG
ncbi:hypothetical protein GCM10010276_23640 [Streptomyces longisporus]|uniref:Uncharacterized protein n=1 Tax=Streptomyces longisporus TaxID=1948 RepID=A0ABN3LIU9_STRLO